MKTKHFSMKSVISMLLAVILVAGTLPVSVFAAQSNTYVDPADNWLKTNNRTNELDANAVVTSGAQYCHVCKKDMLAISYRVPEYTKSSETALNRGGWYSDGTCSDNISKGNLNDGYPGVDAYYTGSHWTKAICQICGTLNPSDMEAYGFNKNVYTLNPCDHSFYIDFDNTTCSQYDEHQHILQVSNTIKLYL